MMSLKNILLICIIFGAGFYLGILFEKQPIFAPHLVKIQEANSEYKFTAPLLGIDIAHTEYFPEYEQLEDEMEELVEEYNSKNVTNVSIYYRNLKDASWMGINENEVYKPGSLFKVPIMIAYLKEAETDSKILDRKIKFDKPELKSAPQDTPPSKSIELGKEYTVLELIEYMIIYSDNNAANLLASSIYLDAKNSFTEMMGNLGLSPFADDTTAKDYSMFLRILYNATYLNNDKSEKALEILSRVEFKEGLLSGLPSDVQTSHKFGQYGFNEDNRFVQEFHECGIVYGDKTYLLCVMTRGDNKNVQIDLIKKVSEKVYNSVVSN